MGETSLKPNVVALFRLTLAHFGARASLVCEIQREQIDLQLQGICA